MYSNVFFSFTKLTRIFEIKIEIKTLRGIHQVFYLWEEFFVYTLPSVYSEKKATRVISRY